MEIQVPNDKAALIYRGGKNDAILYVNQSATDVFLDDIPSLIDTVAVGVTPTSGTKLAAIGGQILFSTRSGFIYARAATVTKIQQL